jgi:hypothetical protein
VSRQRVLVDIDADSPDSGFVGWLERAETASAGDLEKNLGSLRDLVLGDGLTFVVATKSCE